MSKQPDFTPEVLERLGQVSRGRLTTEFWKYVRSWPIAKEGQMGAVLECLHPCNSDEWLRGFGEYLVSRKVEISSND